MINEIQIHSRVRVYNKDIIARGDKALANSKPTTPFARLFKVKIWIR